MRIGEKERCQVRCVIYRCIVCAPVLFGRFVYIFTFLHSVQVFDLDIFHEIFCFLLTLAIEFQGFLSNSKLFIQKLTIE